MTNTMPRPSSSWVIREKATRHVIAETFDARKVAALNTQRYEAVPIRDYLASLNAPQLPGVIERNRQRDPETYSQAKALHELDRAMSLAKSFPAAVETRFAFYSAAVKFGLTDRLNAVADEFLGNASTMSERSLDRVFEDGPVSDEVVRRIVLLCDHDAEFQARVERDAGSQALASWRASCRDLFAMA